MPYLCFTQVWHNSFVQQKILNVFILSVIQVSFDGLGAILDKYRRWILLDV